MNIHKNMHKSGRGAEKTECPCKIDGFLVTFLQNVEGYLLTSPWEQEYTLTYIVGRTAHGKKESIKL